MAPPIPLAMPPDVPAKAPVEEAPGKAPGKVPGKAPGKAPGEAPERAPASPAAGGSTSGKKLRKINKPPKSYAKSIWLVGHIMTLGFGVFYSLYYFQRKSQHRLVPWVCYKLTLMGVWTAYVTSIQSQYNIKSLPHYTTLVATENFQYLLLSVMWFFNRNSFFKILPFMIVSLLQIATSCKLTAVLKLETQLSKVVLYDELFLFVLLLVDTLLLRGTSGYGLVTYCMFMWLRILQSENTRFFLYDNLIKLDSQISKIKNPKVQQGWLGVKKFLSYKQATFEEKYL